MAMEGTAAVVAARGVRAPVEEQADEGEALEVSEAAEGAAVVVATQWTAAALAAARGLEGASVGRAGEAGSLARAVVRRRRTGQGWGAR